MELYIRKTNSMQDLAERLLAFVGTGSAVSIGLGILQGIGIVAGTLTSIFSAYYFYKKVEAQKRKHMWEIKDRRRREDD